MLTREYILSLEAGRKADMHIAEEVMNLRCVHWSDEDIWHENDQGEYESVPRYSTDISAAMDLILSITNKSEKEKCGPCVRMEHDGIWHVRIGTARSMEHELPFAIARCALLTTIQGEPNNA